MITSTAVRAQIAFHFLNAHSYIASAELIHCTLTVHVHTLTVSQYKELQEYIDRYIQFDDVFVSPGVITYYFN